MEVSGPGVNGMDIVESRIVVGVRAADVSCQMRELV